MKPFIFRIYKIRDFFLSLSPLLLNNTKSCNTEKNCLKEAVLFSGYDKFSLRNNKYRVRSRPLIFNIQNINGLLCVIKIKITTKLNMCNKDKDLAYLQSCTVSKTIMSNEIIRLLVWNNTNVISDDLSFVNSDPRLHITSAYWAYFQLFSAHDTTNKMSTVNKDCLC